MRRARQGFTVRVAPPSFPVQALQISFQTVSEMTLRPAAPDLSLAQLVVDASPSAVLVVTGDVITFANSAAAEFFGAPEPASLRGESYSALFAAVLGDPLPIDVADVLCGTRSDCEFAQPGATRWFSLSARPLGEARALFLTEITLVRTQAFDAGRRAATAIERDRSEMTELNERLDAIIRYSPDRVVGVDTSLRIVAMNERSQTDFAGLWGVPIHIGDSLRERMHSLPAAQRDAALSMWERAIDGVATCQFAVFGNTPESMQAYELSFGSVRDRNGAPAGAVMVARDVTDREVALASLRSSEARFRTLGESAPIGIFLTDVGGHCTYANPRMQQIWDLHEATLMTHGFASRVHPDDLPRACIWLGKNGGSDDVRDEFRLVLDDRVERWVLAHSRVIRDDDGQVVGRVGTVDDITEVRQAAQARREMEQKMLRAQKMESLEVMAGGIAHDFNNLLVGMLGNASLALLDVNESSPIHGLLLDIERAATRAADLTRQMLAYSGRGRFIVEPVDLSALVAEMGSLLRTVLSKQAVLRFDLTSPLPSIEADATQVRQVVMNLITNASDAVADRGGEIYVRTGIQTLDVVPTEHVAADETFEPGTYVFVEVQDTGTGMNEATISRIFEPFFTTKFTGRGLGLAATLGIVRGHRGAIQITSEPLQGATFRVFFPALPGVTVASIIAPAQPEGVGEGAILIIDDDVTVQVVARRLLERRGYRVVVAPDGIAGVEQFVNSGEQFALVLLDLTMPRQGGAATMAQLRAINPSLRVLLTSGYREPDVAAQFVGMEPTGFVQKPFRADELYAAVEDALRT